MQIVSLYKLWRGDEFLIPSVVSNYNHVHAMVFVSSEISWTGASGNNTLAPLEAWAKNHDRLKKVHIVNHDTVSQDEQYRTGLEYIRKNFPGCDWIQLVDSDEVWDESAWERSMDFLYHYGAVLSSATIGMWTYAKNMFYRMIGNGEVSPVVFVRPSAGYHGVRFNDVRPTRRIDANVHHFALVRRNVDEVVQKIRVSTAGEGAGDRLSDGWFDNVWELLPKGPAYHYLKGYEHLWQGVTVVSPDEIPPTCAGVKL